MEKCIKCGSTNVYNGKCRNCGRDSRIESNTDLSTPIILADIVFPDCGDCGCGGCGE